MSSHYLVNGICKQLAFGIAAEHDLKERTVQDVHFTLAGTVCKTDQIAADHSVLIQHICRRGKIKCQVEKRRFRSCAAIAIYAKNEVLHRLLHFVIG